VSRDKYEWLIVKVCRRIILIRDATFPRVRTRLLTHGTLKAKCYTCIYEHFFGWRRTSTVFFWIAVAYDLINLLKDDGSCTRRTNLFSRLNSRPWSSRQPSRSSSTTRAIRPLSGRRISRRTCSRTRYGRSASRRCCRFRIRVCRSFCWGISRRCWRRSWCLRYSYNRFLSWSSSWNLS
jgi:hypothetical protein